MGRTSRLDAGRSLIQTASPRGAGRSRTVTSRIIVPIYASIGDAALDEFAELVETTRNAIDM